MILLILCKEDVALSAEEQVILLNAIHTLLFSEYFTLMSFANIIFVCIMGYLSSSILDSISSVSIISFWATIRYSGER